MNEEVKNKIVNFLIDEIRKNKLTMKELDEVRELLKDAYYTDATIK